MRVGCNKPRRETSCATCPSAGAARDTKSHVAPYRKWIMQRGSLAMAAPSLPTEQPSESPKSWTPYETPGSWPRATSYGGKLPHIHRLSLTRPPSDSAHSVAPFAVSLSQLSLVGDLVFPTLAIDESVVPATPHSAACAPTFDTPPLSQRI